MKQSAREHAIFFPQDPEKYTSCAEKTLFIMLLGEDQNRTVLFAVNALFSLILT
jgi:hypothetical protein